MHAYIFRPGRRENKTRETNGDINETINVENRETIVTELLNYSFPFPKFGTP